MKFKMYLMLIAVIYIAPHTVPLAAWVTGGVFAIWAIFEHVKDLRESE